MELVTCRISHALQATAIPRVMILVYVYEWLLQDGFGYVGSLQERGNKGTVNADNRPQHLAPPLAVLIFTFSN